MLTSWFQTGSSCIRMTWSNDLLMLFSTVTSSVSSCAVCRCGDVLYMVCYMYVNEREDNSCRKYRVVTRAGPSRSRKQQVLTSAITGPLTLTRILSTKVTMPKVISIMRGDSPWVLRRYASLKTSKSYQGKRSCSTQHFTKV